MSAVFAIDNVQGATDTLFREAVYLGTITFSGTYPVGGDTLSFGVQGVLSNVAPTRVELFEQPSATTSQVSTGYGFVYAKGTTAANGKVQINASQGTPFSGSYGTAFASTVVKARAHFPLGQ